MTDNNSLATKATAITRDTDDLHISIDADAEGGSHISLLRTVTKKAYRRRDQHIVSSTVVVELTAVEAVALINDLAIALNRIDRSA